MPTSPVIFDLDGTLVDSLDDIAAALDHALTAAGLAAAGRTAAERWIGDGARQLVERAVGHGTAPAAPTPALLDAVDAGFRRRYASHLVVATAAYPGIAAVLAALAGAGRPLAVLSNKPDELTRRVVAALFPTVAFAAVVGQRAGVPIKPDPAAALAIAAVLGARPANCIFVGDSEVDLACARAAGMRAVGVSWGFRPRAALIAAGAAEIVDRTDDLGAALTRY